MPFDKSGKHYTEYRGKRLYWRTTFSTGYQQLICYIEGWPGIWNTESAAKSYIDFRLK